MKLKTLFTAIALMGLSAVWAQDNAAQLAAPASKTEKLTKAEKKVKKEQQKHEQKIAEAEGVVTKCEINLAEEKFKYDKMQSDLQTDISQGKLSPLNLAERQIKVSDQNIKVTNREEELQKAKSKLSELQKSQTH